MSKSIDLSRSVYELVTENPEIADIMEKLGFGEVKKPAVLNSVGRIMTIPKGAKMKGIDMLDVITAFIGAGFTIEGSMPPAASPAHQKTETMGGWLESYLKSNGNPTKS